MKIQQSTKIIAGVDISKARLDVTLDGTSVKCVPNTPEGCAQLAAKLAEVSLQIVVVAEPTGGYEKALVAACTDAKLTVRLVHASRVRSYAHATGIEAKTDQIDAKLLWSFGHMVESPAHVTPSQGVSDLRQLLDYRTFLVDQRSGIESRLETASPKLASLYKKQLAQCEKAIKEVDAKIKDTIDSDQDLKSRSERLQQVKAIGPVLSATILAFMPELGQVCDKRAAHLAGVCPIVHQSGAQKGRAAIRGGRGSVRKVLYMAATCAIRYNSILSAFYKRLLERSKPKKVALVAVMRKLLTLINRILSDTTFSPQAEPNAA